MVRKKIGTITLKTTVRRQVQVRQQYSYRAAPQPINVVNHIQAQETTKVFPKIVTHSLPHGVYAPQVEQFYNDIQQRSKPEEQSNQALYDVFISHASEDKKDFVDPLVQALQDAGIRVWYDTLEMQWGKSLREQIDNGIKRSKYAILVLSKNFFAKQWTKRELDGILAKEGVTGAAPLPIWYDITYDDVYEFSPTLCGLYSLTTDKNSIDDICQAFRLVLEKEPIRS